MEKIWGAQFWYVLHTIAFSYPKHPNKVTKRKYYDTVMNIPLFLPNEEIGTKFSKLLDNYPVTPYLDSRESFIKWTHFIHNRVNELFDKPLMSYANFINKYTQQSRSNNKSKNIHTHKIIGVGLLIIIAIIYKLR
jgi:hypothetical protein|tara:strand:- start:324 stop:728 length:405 start_codon:yes stop_codon:yes gene_type:complete